MVAFIKDGMDIPDHLVHAQENGRVVFFCGAGISMAAGLPDFEKLVNSIYSTLHIRKEDTEKKLMKAKQYDRVLEHLEQWLIGHKEMLRKPLMQILQPESDAMEATETHKALFELATSQNRITRLVTTNFDRLFEKVISQQNRSITPFLAPHMPEATSGQWSGLVYLHGRLPESYDESKLNRLVLTSSDFGAAYLTEQWATNFVKALLQNYIVCFVGYSLDDHLLQYLMSASASGNSRHNAYAFAALAGDEQKEYAQWRAKGVTPVFYNPENGHVQFHRTLKAWADTYSAGIEGKKKIITEYAGAGTPPPSPSSPDYAYVVQRVRWALTDAVVAKHFCDMKPVPALEWIESLLANSFGRDDLPLFGVASENSEGKVKEFAFLRRPAPTALAPLMRIFTTNADRPTRWDEVMENLAKWIVRQVGNPNLIGLIIKNGYQLHRNLASAIEWGIYMIELYESNGMQAELASIADGAPYAIPCKNMRVLWHLILSQKIKHSPGDSGFYSLLTRVKKNGWTTLSRHKMCELLSPRIRLSPRSDLLTPGYDDGTGPQPLTIADIASCDIELVSDGIHRALEDHAKNHAWKMALPDLLPDFTALLREVLNLMHLIEEANDRMDLSFYHQPSILPHQSNRKSHQWTALIDLARESWIAVSKSSPEKARGVAEQWMREQYPLFKRLGFFAAAHDAVIPHEQALNWLLSENHKWLWALATKRETSRLIAAKAPQLPRNLLRNLEAAIVKGPSREIFRKELTDSEISESADLMVLFRLAKLQANGAVLGDSAARTLKKLQAKHPDREIRKDGEDEISFGGYAVRKEADVAEEPQEPPLPIQRHELVEWVKNYQEPNHYPDTRWRAYCSDERSDAASVLQELADKSEWPKEAWREALHIWGWGNDFLLPRTSFLAVCGILANAPTEIIQSLGIQIPMWMRQAAETIDGADKEILALSNRIIEVQHKQERRFGYDIVGQAHAHPVGSTVKALLEVFERHAAKKAKKDMANILEIFSKVCNTQNDQFRHGRIVLAECTTALYYHEREWTKKYFLPLFDWKQSEQEAEATWKGWLTAYPRFPHLLLLELKDAIWQTAENCNKLYPVYTDQFAELLLYASLYSLGGVPATPGGKRVLSKAKLRDATAKLPPKALEHLTWCLYSWFDADENQSEFWKKRARPYLEYIWPKSEGNRKTQKVSEHLAMICTATQAHFSDALEMVTYWLQPLGHTYWGLTDLHTKGICKQFPNESLDFLTAIIRRDFRDASGELQTCLDEISGADPNAPDDPRFLRLRRIALR